MAGELAADPAIIGSSITLGSGSHTVVGIAPAALGRAGFGADIFVPWASGSGSGCAVVFAGRKSNAC